MARRKGMAQDHAVLLCSLLLGCKKDAYVCKGMVYSDSGDGRGNEGFGVERRDDSLVEHVWVMTREGDWVTFWEPCSRQMFHMNKRCISKRSVSRKQGRTTGVKQHDLKDDRKGT